jgi:UDP-N-acetylglucosamine--N-acetylmuramyl-(pentapeptide) pyrophosphoryl-undecaprenol N-acetylglucosamine transferase
VAERARERFPGCRILFFRTRRKVEERVFAEYGFDTRSMNLETPKASPIGWLKYSMQSVRAIGEIRRLLQVGFDAAFGLGGYASLPGIIAARKEEIPVVLLEQNQVPGKVNRFLAPFVNAVSCPNTAAAEGLRGRREITGNPVRREVLTAAFRRRRWFGASTFSSRKRRVLVCGGSQGAHGVNRAIVDALGALEELRDRISWLHVAGDADCEMVAQSYRERGWEAEVRSFLPDLPYEMANSDLVIARSGGTTLAELAVLGVPAVLVPYPHHKDQHQLRNAQLLVGAGGARLIPENELSADRLREVFEEILFTPERLLEMEDAALSLGKPKAADAVLDLVLNLKESN